MKRILFAGCLVFLASVETVYAGGIFGKSKTSAAPVRIESAVYSGCLRNGTSGGIWLTEINGPEAPASRSWKTLYLKKQKGALEVIATRDFRIGNHVGQTIEVIGRRDDTKVHVRRVKVLHRTCG
jgi:hypothetical protein